MAERTGISWADHTFNPWIGCTKVSGACERCYAEDWNERYGLAPGWGPGVPRHRTSRATWRGPVTWNRRAAITGIRPRVFCASLADVLDNEVDPQWRVDLFALWRSTPNLRWMVLTKRIGNAVRMLPPDWPMSNVGLMATLENQEVWNRDWPKLAALPAPWRGVSVEPMLGPVDIGDARPDWIICGGESGAGYRPIDPAWVRSLRDQCAQNGITFHFKQWGGRTSKANGCMLDGREWKDFPPVLKSRERRDGLEGMGTPQRR
jgi:protein gp37